jgi:hypothetical protein
VGGGYRALSARNTHRFIRSPCPRAESRLSQMLTPSVGYDNPYGKRRTLGSGEGD